MFLIHIEKYCFSLLSMYNSLIETLEQETSMGVRLIHINGASFNPMQIVKIDGDGDEIGANYEKILDSLLSPFSPKKWKLPKKIEWCFHIYTKLEDRRGPDKMHAFPIMFSRNFPEDIVESFNDIKSRKIPAGQDPNTALDDLYEDLFNRVEEVIRPLYDDVPEELFIARDKAHSDWEKALAEIPTFVLEVPPNSMLLYQR